jgi:hypothetical protein
MPPGRAIELAVVIDGLPRQKIRQYLETLAQHHSSHFRVDFVAKGGQLAREVVADAKTQDQSTVRDVIERHDLTRHHGGPTANQWRHHDPELHGGGGGRDRGQADVGIEDVADAPAVLKVIPQKEAVPTRSLGIDR